MRGSSRRAPGANVAWQSWR
uniref:Uncharacterized protein n=1 Tax=Arundo donax TaxID=35708 RepID=A0A0A9BHR4_ARUDO